LSVCDITCMCVNWDEP